MRKIALLLTVALFGSGCTLVGGGPSYEITAEFARAFNLFPGSEVRLLGVVVGTVTDVEAPVGSDVAVATMRVDEDARVPPDATATIVQGALLGERFVSLSPAHTGGAVLRDGARIPLARTDEPAEFDEILESLNDVVDRLPPDELARLVRNSADVLRDRGEELGDTFEEVAGAVDALERTDDELIALLDRMADLSETLETRDEAIGDVIEDYGTLMSTLAAEREVIDAAIGETARMVGEVRSLVEEHAPHLDEDVETVTRVGRTLQRNLSEIDLLLHGQAELYRHAERVFDMQRNWLPLVNHDEGLQELFRDRLGERLADLCGRLDIDECDDPADWEGELPAQVCLPGILACEDADGGQAGTPLDEVLADSFAAVPELPARLSDELERERLAGDTAGPVTSAMLRAAVAEAVS